MTKTRMKIAKTTKMANMKKIIKRIRIRWRG